MEARGRNDDEEVGLTLRAGLWALLLWALLRVGGLYCMGRCAVIWAKRLFSNGEVARDERYAALSPAAVVTE